MDPKHGDPLWLPAKHNRYRVDCCEILHQLIDGKHPIIYRVSTCFNHPFAGTGFRNHPQYQYRPSPQRPDAMPKAKAKSMRFKRGSFQGQALASRNLNGALICHLKK